MSRSGMNEFGGAWTEQKLQILEGYLQAYTTALKRQNFQLVYVDAFAGTGYINVDSPEVNQGLPALDVGVDEPTANVLKGSALLALEVRERPFDRFLFVEQNPAYVQELERLRGEFHGRDIQVWPGDANQVLRLWCDEQNRKLSIPWRGERAVIFLDPFATEVEWQTVAAIAETKSVDLWILFPLSALTRILPRYRQPNEAYASRLDRVYGGPEWRDLYQTREAATRQPALFMEDSLQSLIRNDQQAIVSLYLDKLQSTFARVATQPKWFYNSRQSPLFAFMFAASNPAGANIAVQIANHLLERW